MTAYVLLSETYDWWCVCACVWLKSCISQHKLTTDNKADARILTDPNAEQRGWWEATEPAAPSNLPSFPRDSSSFWIWFSKTNMATANASSARSCNLGGIMTRSSPIKSSRSKIWSVHARRRRHWKRTRTYTHTHARWGGGGYKAVECLCMALSPLLRVCGYILLSRSFGLPHMRRLRAHRGGFIK